jgi:pimeloyl-ACP methyl ester carboxylesterase
MSKIFLIAGLGADTRIFNNIELGDDHNITPVDWIEPNERDTLTTYAQKLIHQYFITDNSIVIGNSLGGMLAIEIAKQVRLNKVILISSIKTIKEVPWFYKVLKALPVHRLIPGKFLATFGVFIKPVFGKMSKDDLWLFNDMLRKSSPVFLKWAMQTALKWDNETIPPNVYHINGNKDKVFDYKLITDFTLIKDGTHMMIFDKAKQINKLLKAILKKK